MRGIADGRSEARPGGETAEPAAAHQPDREAGLARGGAGEELRPRDEIDVGALAQPTPALDEFRAEIAEMGDRPAERREAEFQEGEKDFARRPRPKSDVGLARDFCFGAHGNDDDAFGECRFKPTMDPPRVSTAGK